MVVYIVKPYAFNLLLLTNTILTAATFVLILLNSIHSILSDSQYFTIILFKYYFV